MTQSYRPTSLWSWAMQRHRVTWPLWRIASVRALMLTCGLWCLSTIERLNFSSLVLSLLRYVVLLIWIKVQTSFLHYYLLLFDYLNINLNIIWWRERLLVCEGRQYFLILIPFVGDDFLSEECSLSRIINLLCFFTLKKLFPLRNSSLRFRLD
jgi:hypothetical protein